MKKYIDGGLSFLRKQAFQNYLEPSEKWLAKIGLGCMYFAFPVIALVFIIRYHRAITMICGSSILVALGVVIACLFAGYIAEKMLEYVKPTISGAQTKIVNGAFLDVLAVLSVLATIVVFFVSLVSAIKQGSFEIFFGGMLGSLVCGFFAAMLMEPQKALNIKIEDSATPAQSLIAICSLLVKASYRLVPIAFGAIAIVGLVCGIHLVFSDGSVNLIMLFAKLALGGALLPLIGYILFLVYYFVLDFLESFFSMSNDVKVIAESKDSRKAK